MIVTHTNRKGKTYYLHQGKTELGNPKYFFALRDEGDLVEVIPPGYEVYENPNGQVFLRRTQPQIITDEEVAVAEDGILGTRNIQAVRRDTAHRVNLPGTLSHTRSQARRLLTET